MDNDVFDALGREVDQLLNRLRSLKEENRALKTSLQESQAQIVGLEEEKQAALAASGEVRRRVEVLLQRIEAEVEQD